MITVKVNGVVYTEDNLRKMTVGELAEIKTKLSQSFTYFSKRKNMFAAKKDNVNKKKTGYILNSINIQLGLVKNITKEKNIKNTEKENHFKHKLIDFYRTAQKSLSKGAFNKLCKNANINDIDILKIQNVLNEIAIKLNK